MITDADRSAVKVRMAAQHIAEVVLDRVPQLNAMTMGIFLRIGEAFREITDSIVASRDDETQALQDVRCVILRSASPKLFTAGIDFASAAEVTSMHQRDDSARTALRTFHFVSQLQDAFTAVAECPVPVIAAVHGACIGAGVDLIAACDIRLASSDAFFTVKEVDVGITADLGTLQRLPRIVGNQSLVREWCYTARKIPADEALRAGLVSGLAEGGAEAVVRRALEMAKLIATKPPVAVVGTKASLNQNDSAVVHRGLRHVALLNASALQTDDIPNAMTAAKKKQLPTFSKL